MNILYLSINEMTFFTPYIAILALMVGVISGFIGVGGGFILTPALIAIGIPPFIAVGTVTTHIFCTSLNAVRKYHKTKTITSYKTAILITIGGGLGVIAGTSLLRYLSYNTPYLDNIINVSFLALLVVVALLLILKPQSAANDNKSINKYNLQTTMLILIMGGLIGLIAGFLGLGGGILVIPFLSYFMGFQYIEARAIAQFNIACSTFLGLMLHAFIHHNINLRLALILVMFGFVGSFIGLSLGFRLSERVNKRVFLFIIFCTACMIIYGLLG